MGHVNPRQYMSIKFTYDVKVLYMTYPPDYEISDFPETSFITPNNG